MQNSCAQAQQFRFNLLRIKIMPLLQWFIYNEASIYAGQEKQYCNGRQNSCVIDP